MKIDLRRKESKTSQYTTIRFSILNGSNDEGRQNVSTDFCAIKKQKPNKYV